MLNYRHLYYFWMVGREGGFARAAERLGMAVQTVSVQVRELEKSLGHQLLRPQGRGVVLTAAGKAAMARADEIFQLGTELVETVQAVGSRPVQRLAVGLSDGLSKLTAHALLTPVLATPGLHLVCHDGEFEPLLAELAGHRLDLVLAGQPAPVHSPLALSCTRLVRSAVDWLGPTALVKPKAATAFPACLATLPVLLPTAHSALRPVLDHWFDAQRLRPNVVGEFEDSALMAVFAARGMGVFPVSSLGAADARVMPGLRRVGTSSDVYEEVYALRVRRGNRHPLVQRIVQAVSG